MRRLTSLYLASSALAMLPVFAPPDGGDGSGSNVVTIDLSPVMNAVHEAEDLESKAETFISGIIDRLKGVATQPNPPDTSAVLAQVAALAAELESKNGEFKGALVAASSSSNSDPAVTSLSPSSGPEAGGTTVTITGKNFTGALAVNFGPSAAEFVVNSDTEIVATSPAGTGGVSVAVQGPVSQSTQVGSYSYVAAAPADGDGTTDGADKTAA